MRRKDKVDGDLCVYCGENLGHLDDGKNKKYYLDHVKVHKVLRHKKIPIKVYGQLYSAVKNCKMTLLVLDKL